MMNLTKFTVFLLGFCLVFWRYTTRAETFYVALNGNDSWSGTLSEPNPSNTDGPFATLTRARNAVRSVIGGGLHEPVYVMIRGGKYFLSSTFTLGSSDSGTSGYPITWQAYPGETAILSGGKKVTGWQTHQGQIVKANVPAGAIDFRQLFYNGERQIRSRHLNFQPANPLYGGWTIFQAVGSDPSSFVYPSGYMTQTLAKPTMAKVNFFLKWPGWGGYTNVTSIDYNNRLIYTDYTYAGDPLIGFSTDCRFTLENTLEYLDMAGEWCLYSDENKIYFWPPTPIDSNSEVIIPALPSLVRMTETNWVNIVGLNFTETNFWWSGVTGGYALYLDGAQHCKIEKNYFDAVGTYAIRLSGTNSDCTFNIIRKNEVSYSGSTGIYLGDRILSNEIVDNHIHHCGFFDKYGDGIRQEVRYPDSNDNLIAHNYIHDVPHRAICLGENPYGRNTVEYNEIRRTCLEMSEGGAINSWMDGHAGDLGIPLEDPRAGHTIRYNLITDTMGCKVSGGSIVTPVVWPIIALYLDNMSSNCDVYGNIVVRSGVGVIINPGRNNRFYNNIFVDCQYNFCSNLPPQLIEAADQMINNSFTRNICYNTESGTFLYKLNEWNNQLFSEADYNLFFNTTGYYRTDKEGQLLTLSQWQALGYDINSLTSDPLFIVEPNDYYSLDSGSPAFNLGFIPIDIEKIGIRSCSEFPPGDITQDCIVDTADFARLAEKWLECTKPECD